MQESPPPRLCLRLRDVCVRRPARRPALPEEAEPAAADHRDTKPDSVPQLPRRLPVLAERAAARRPRRRGDCMPGGRNAARPCPWATCRHSLLVDADVDPETGAATVAETGEVDSLPHTCALDVAELTDVRGRGVILRQLEPYFGRTRERVRQIELRALGRLRDGLADGHGAELQAILGALDREARRGPRGEPEG